MKNRITTLLAATTSAFLLLGGAAYALTIDDLFGPSISSASDAALLEGAITQATNQIASLYTNPETVTILFQQGRGSFLGESDSTIYFIDEGTYNFASALDAITHPENAPLTEGLLHVAQGNGFPDSNMIVTGADLRALGFNAPGGFDATGHFTGSGGVDSVITLSTSYDLNFTGDVPAYNGGNLEFNGINTVQHEVDEALGIGGTGSSLNIIYFLQHGGSTGNAREDQELLNSIGPLDRFRFAAPGVPSFSTSSSASAYFSLDGGATNLADFNQHHQGDYGDLGPTTTPCSAGGFGGPPDQIQDAFSCNNEPTIGFKRGAPEDIMLQSIGYNPSAAPEPSMWGLIIAGIATIGGALRLRNSLNVRIGAA